MWTRLNSFTNVLQLRNRECLRNFTPNNVEKIKPIGLNDARPSTRMIVFLFNTAD